MYYEAVVVNVLKKVPQGVLKISGKALEIEITAAIL